VQENHRTYTYTARNANDPAKVITFTLYDDHLRVNLTGVIEQAERVAEAEEKPSEIGRQLSTQAKPTIMKLAENVSGPTHVGDVNADLSNENLQMTFWQRVGGLRLAPVVFRMGQVDNVDAAEAFVEKLEDRKEASSPAGKFFGPLDYWAGWAGLVMLIGILFRWPRKRSNNGNGNNPDDQGGEND
jgi:hypothetical protein